MVASSRTERADPQACEVMVFWFGEEWSSCAAYAYRKDISSKWFMGGPAVDEEIKSKFQVLRGSLVRGELDAWLQHPINALAGIVVMDQMSRNMFRGTPEMYAADYKALSWAKHAVNTGLCAHLPLVQRLFLMLPYEHSEVLEDQQESVRLAEEQVVEVEAGVAAGEPGAPELAELLRMFVKYAQAHRDVVEQWGRFPHRNKILGREDTPEETAGFAAGKIPAF